MHHEIPTDYAMGVGQTLRKQLRLRIQQQAWGADSVAADDYHACRLLVEVALPVIVNGAGCAAFGVHADLTDARPRP